MIEPRICHPVTTVFHSTGKFIPAQRNGAEAKSLDLIFRRLRSLGVTELQEAMRFIRMRCTLQHVLPSHVDMSWTRSGMGLEKHETNWLSSVKNPEFFSEFGRNRYNPLDQPHKSPVVMHLWALRKRQYECNNIWFLLENLEQSRKFQIGISDTW